MTQEWMPENPCEDCENLLENLCAGRVRWCKRYADFKDAVKAQTKLLEYLIKKGTKRVSSTTGKPFEFTEIGADLLRTMLSQLEEQTK